MTELGTTKNHETYGYWNKIKQQQKNVQINNVFHLTTEDLALESSVHFTNKSHITMGKRFAIFF